jgi:hypothetical protein
LELAATTAEAVAIAREIVERTQTRMDVPVMWRSNCRGAGPDARRSRTVGPKLTSSVTTDKTAVALRVLTALNDKQEPDPKDVVLLRADCPDGRDVDLDEVACMVIQDVLKAKREWRVRVQRETA